VSFHDPKFFKLGGKELTDWFCGRLRKDKGKGRAVGSQGDAGFNSLNWYDSACAPGRFVDEMAMESRASAENDDMSHLNEAAQQEMLDRISTCGGVDWTPSGGHDWSGSTGGNDCSSPMGDDWAPSGGDDFSSPSRLDD
jgi:hypothetical protein